LRALPALYRPLRAPGVAASWAAAAALTTIDALSARAAQAGLPDPPPGPRAAGEAFARVVEHGDPHVIRLAGTAAEVYAPRNRDALAAAIRATQLIAR
jgi:hypothetical protein